MINALLEDEIMRDETYWSVLSRIWMDHGATGVHVLHRERIHSLTGLSVRGASDEL